MVAPSTYWGPALVYSSPATGALEGMLLIQSCAALGCCAAPGQAEDVQEVHLAAAARRVLTLAPAKEAAHLQEHWLFLPFPAAATSQTS